MDNVRVGVIGIGNMGRGHASYLAAGDIPGAELAAVCDISPAAREWAQNKFGEGVQLFDNVDSLFKAKAVDGVIISTPHYLHPPLAIQSFKNGVHALVDKPAGVYTKQVREMNEAAAQTDMVFGIMFNQRTLGYHQKMRELVASGELGEIKRTMYVITDWFRTQSYYDSGGWRATWEGEGGGVLLNQSPHNLDLWQWVCGMPKRVRAFCSFGKYHDIEVEDEVTAYVEYENGATGIFITTTGEAPGTKSWEIVGDRGKLVLANNKLTFWRTTVPVSQFLRESESGFAKPETWMCEIPVKGGEEHRGIIKNWVQAIREGTPLLAQGAEGINGVELANAMLLSAWTNDWVELPIDDDKYYKKLKQKIKGSTAQKKQAEGKVVDISGTF